MYKIFKSRDFEEKINGLNDELVIINKLFNDLKLKSQGIFKLKIDNYNQYFQSEMLLLKTIKQLILLIMGI